MKIGILGAGEVAQAIARAAIAAGHEIALSNSGNDERLAAAVSAVGAGAIAVSAIEAAGQDVVLLAVPWSKVEATLGGLPAWNGRILIDATNPFLETGSSPVMADLGDVGASEIVAGAAPGARVVKAFNSIVMKRFEAGPREGSARRVLFVSGDDDEAKRHVSSLIDGLGFAVIDLGGLQVGGRMQQAGGPIAGKDLLLAT
jgi:predicted dinucleotide-binding enzyme